MATLAIEQKTILKSNFTIRDRSTQTWLLDTIPTQDPTLLLLIT
jgi:hypothetical protein